MLSVAGPARTPPSQFSVIWTRLSRAAPASGTPQASLRLLLEQGEQPRVKELTALEEVLAQEPLLLEAALFEDTG